ncbi:ninjurin-1-like [Mercenaria mercenaria]|uniref:ninjurin-1-like n=1 Tax=Mercenaria mercenaria TaxID=6596 RepID=UPI00234F6A34|nr:ninjurin-1-like [Mercenaria mercenaria]
MSTNKSDVYSDSALNESLKNTGWKARGGADDTAADTKKTTEHANSVSVVQMDDTPDEADGDGALKVQHTDKVPNAYVGKRNFIHKLMDVALIMANVSQLKALLASENEYFYLLLTFICMSIGLQVVFTICMVVINSIENTLEEHNKQDSLPQEHCPKIKRMTGLATWLDRAGSIIVLFVIVSNVLIAGFGVEGNMKHTGSQS